MERSRDRMYLNITERYYSMVLPFAIDVFHGKHMIAEQRSELKIIKINIRDSIFALIYKFPYSTLLLLAHHCYEILTLNFRI